MNPVARIARKLAWRRMLSRLAEARKFGALAAKGYDVHPAIGSMAREDRRYSGGFITATYGSAGGGTLDAIQIEFGTDLRTKERRPQTAEDLAEAIVRFHGRYLAAAAR